MKILYIVDEDIKLKDAEKLAKDYGKFIKKHSDITPQSFFEAKYLKDHPVINKYPKASWVANLAKDVHTRYSGEGTDHVVIWVHEDNWKSDPPGPKNGIWGINWSNIYSGYQVHYCRWDAGSNGKVNTFGTLWHEMHHSFDALIETYTGVNIDNLLGVSDWDSQITHGGSDRWEYMRYKENTDSLKAIAHLLVESYTKRQKIYLQKIGIIKEKISLLEQIVILIRQLNNRKHTIK